MSITMSCEDVESSLSLESLQPCRRFTISEILLATANFDESMVIGRGGFGKVYIGTITNGVTHLDVAVKRLDTTSNQGALEFWAEVKMLSKVRHCHLVSLIGYCNDIQEMILVYEFMPRGTLEDHLHKLRAPLTWIRRLKICIGAARGLDYLHTGTGIKHGVIHRDVKSSNILLDDSWAAKISDFGLSKIGPTNQPSTYVNTMVKGTFGYLDPDYYQTGRLTRKSDVYAFGVVLFEVLCEKRAVDRSLDEEQWGLASWAQDSIKEGRLKQIVDSNISGKISPRYLKEFAQLAVRCLHSHPKQRPTMAQVVVALECILVSQEKADHKLLPGGMTMFGKKTPMFVFPSNRENSAGSKNSKSVELYLVTIQHEDQLLRRFHFDTINVATENFSEANRIIFHRGLGSMYKGRLQNGEDITIIRRPCPDHDHYMNELLINEVSITVMLKHKNLIELVGYCIDGAIVLLVYKFAPHTTLDSLIRDPWCSILDWNKRYKILLGIARVLVYLHNKAPVRIIHGSVRPGNIVLDENFDPKLSNFELAKAIDETDTRVECIVGTWRYPTPEYLTTTSHLSTKDDIFSFGVSLLETVTGRSSFDQLSETKRLYEYVWKNWLEGTSTNIIDPRIDVDSSLMTKFIEIGLLCVQANAADRPTIEEVLSMLLGNSSLILPVSNMRARMIRTRSKCINAPFEDYDTREVTESLTELCPR